MMRREPVFTSTVTAMPGARLSDYVLYRNFVDRARHAQRSSIVDP